MDASRRDFDQLGLSHDDWKAFILGRGIIDPLKLNAARAAIARLGGYSTEQANDTALTDSALRSVAARYPQFWLQRDTLSHEEKIRLIQARQSGSRGEAESQLEQIAEDRRAEAEIFGRSLDEM